MLPKPNHFQVSPLANCLVNIHQHFRRTLRIWNFIFRWSVWVRSFTDSDLPGTDNIIPFENAIPITRNKKSKIKQRTADWSD